MLLEHGVAVDQESDSETALYVAVFNNHLKVAEVNLQNEYVTLSAYILLLRATLF